MTAHMARYWGEREREREGGGGKKEETKGGTHAIFSPYGMQLSMYLSIHIGRRSEVSAGKRYKKKKKEQEEEVSAAHKMTAETTLHHQYNSNDWNTATTITPMTTHSPCRKQHFDNGTIQTPGPPQPPSHR